MSRTAQAFYKTPEAPDSHYVDNVIYTSDDIFRQEQEKIFSRVWKFVCHESEISKVNDYRTVTVAETPLIICRGKDGSIRSFVNACSHRGPLVLRNPRGNARTFECLFHRWTYDNTTGICKTRPGEPGFAEVGPKIGTCGLRQVRAEVYLGLVFVNLDDGAEPLKDFLSNALELEEEILGTVELEVFDYFEQVLHTNWKNWQETNMDLYHEYMHAINRRTSMGERAYYERNWRLYPRGHAAIERYKVRYDKQKGWSDRSPHLRLPGLDPSEFQLIDIFPDLAINARGTVIRITTLKLRFQRQKRLSNIAALRSKVCHQVTECSK